MDFKQTMFKEFFKSIVKPGKEDEAMALLEEGFRLQKEGKMDMAYFTATMPKYMALVKEDSIDKLKEAMASFQKNLK